MRRAAFPAAPIEARGFSGTSSWLQLVRRGARRPDRCHVMGGDPVEQIFRLRLFRRPPSKKKKKKKKKKKNKR
eukprot:NODE_11369_length_283_cov_78.456140.p1 GENE.NODE_11369_length_283_cov_78.456140~~NODE_11369_length_283_cov_78.456140.p1  ORF type:complete len:82 (-),score=42.46 NODE_11369_length_283_cov_78.456140:21-239(-)